MPVCWNGRRGGLKIRCQRWRVGSSPTTGTKMRRPLHGAAAFCKEGTRTGAGVNGAPGALQSRDPASAAAEVESHHRHHVRRTQLRSVSAVCVRAAKTAHPLSPSSFSKSNPLRRASIWIPVRIQIRPAFQKRGIRKDAPFLVPLLRRERIRFARFSREGVLFLYKLPPCRHGT